jgi:hypothetical protein
VETSDRPCGRKSSGLAFGVTGKGEARTSLLEGTEAGAAGSIIKASGVGAKDRPRLIQRTAVYGPVRTVVWEGRSREAPPYPDLCCLLRCVGRYWQILLQKSAILAARFRPRFFETSSYYAPLGSEITYQLY